MYTNNTELYYNLKNKIQNSNCFVHRYNATNYHNSFSFVLGDKIKSTFLKQGKKLHIFVILLFKNQWLAPFAQSPYHFNDHTLAQ